ncbi:hypothetical protein HF086_005536 [Spodoptera exigua]|uniref:Uncharacterized protein n=1 Tax=Spodoptera exigua TaxID=7107 RepID=A0A922MS44_SPOEX|nr:hypothetical protein HF086_005536 [Spodoptera exigua]
MTLENLLSQVGIGTKQLTDRKNKNKIVTFNFNNLRPNDFVTSFITIGIRRFQFTIITYIMHMNPLHRHMGLLRHPNSKLL